MGFLRHASQLKCLLRVGILGSELLGIGTVPRVRVDPALIGSLRPFAETIQHRQPALEVRVSTELERRKGRAGFVGRQFGFAFETHRRDLGQPWPCVAPCIARCFSSVVIVDFGYSFIRSFWD